jgi:hypothetical protein
MSFSLLTDPANFTGLTSKSLERSRPKHSPIMSPVQRVLLILNRAAGTGQNESTAEKLALLFKQGLPEPCDVQVKLVSDHPAARACTAEFLGESEAAALVVAGGGGGTLRAVIEGICDSRNSAELPGPDRVRVAALRMGSGNVLAKQFGVPQEPFIAARGLLLNLKAGRTIPCCVMRCKIRASSGTAEVQHAVTLGGLGQFGRIPSDLARWHARLPMLRKAAARFFGIERLTNLEYALSLGIRSISCMLFPDHAEMVETHFQNRQERFRLLSGIVMNFPIRAIPLRPAVGVEEEALVVYLIPHTGRFAPLWQIVAPQRLIPHMRSLRLEKNQRLEVRFLDRERVEFFLDEDPVTTYGELSIEVAGSIAFVPGADYQLTSDGQASP